MNKGEREEDQKLQKKQEEDGEEENEELDDRLSIFTVSKHTLHIPTISFSRRLHHSLLLK